MEEQQNVACCILCTAQINNMQPIQTEDFEVEVGELPDGELPDGAYVSLLFPTPHEKIPLIEIVLPPRGMEIKLLDSVWCAVAEPAAPFGLVVGWHAQSVLEHFPIPPKLHPESQWHRLP